MQIESFSLVNAFDALSSCEDPDATWVCVNEIAHSLGVAAVNIGEIDITTGRILWARSSMSQSWLDIYMERQFFNVDPLVKLFHQKNSRLTVYCDAQSIKNGLDGGDPELSQALNDAGYRLLNGVKFAHPNAQVGTMVTLCFNEMDKDKFNENIDQWMTISALFAAFPMTPNGSSGQNVFAFEVPVLTKREVEVLSLLAKGNKTARIAGELDLAEITVAKHFRTARIKLNAATREQAVITAVKYKLISV